MSLQPRWPRSRNSWRVARSMAGKDACYVLVRTSTEAFALYEHLRAAKVPARVAPAPHGMQACCGTSVLLDPADVSAAQAVIDALQFPIERIVRVECAVNPARDRYC